MIVSEAEFRENYKNVLKTKLEKQGIVTPDDVLDLAVDYGIKCAFGDIHYTEREET